jgi:CheY-like chemotaxis protein
MEHQSAQGPPHGPPTPPPPRAPPRVLVVADDDALRALLTDLLGEAGCEVVAVADGTAALALLGPHWRPELVLLDADLAGTEGGEPGGGAGGRALDGPGVTRAYYAMPGPHAPIVLLTATDPPAAPAGPIAGVLPKPFDLDAVLALVRQHTEGTPGGDPAGANRGEPAERPRATHSRSARGPCASASRSTGGVG